jgi:hypothetical protein
MTRAIDVRRPALRMAWEEDTLVLSLAPLQGRWAAERHLLLTLNPFRALTETEQQAIARAVQRD